MIGVWGGFFRGSIGASGVVVSSLFRTSVFAAPFAVGSVSFPVLPHFFAWVCIFRQCGLCFFRFPAHLHVLCFVERTTAMEAFQLVRHWISCDPFLLFFLSRVIIDAPYVVDCASLVRCLVRFV